MKARDFLAVCSGVFTCTVAVTCFALYPYAKIPRLGSIVRIRFVNQTGLDLEHLLVGRGRGFGALPNGASSGYHFFHGLSGGLISVRALTPEGRRLEPLGYCGNVEGDLPTGAYRCILTRAEPAEPDLLLANLQEDRPALPSPGNLPRGERAFAVVPLVTEAQAITLAEAVPPPTGLQRERFVHREGAFFLLEDQTWFVRFDLLPDLHPDALHPERGYVVSLDPSGRFGRSDAYQ